MSADFSKILVKDDRLEVVDNIKYAVIKGGQNVTAAQFGAISQSNSQLVFNIQVPSEQTLIDRRVMLEADFKIQVTSCGYTWGAARTNITKVVGTGCGYGQTASLAPYPLHQVMTVASATINNNTVSVNIRDVLPAIQRLLEERELSSYNGTTPNYTDPLYSYADALVSSNNPLAGQYTSADPDFNGRGSIALTSYDIDVTGANAVETFGFHINEPLMISPFIYSNPKCNGQGFYGIQNMNIVLNLGDFKRAFRGLVGVNGAPGSDSGVAGPIAYSAATVFASPGGDVINTTAAGQSLGVLLDVQPVTSGNSGSMFSRAALKFMFLTPHPSDLMPARNIVPYYELPRYITSNPLQGSRASLVASRANGVIPYSTVDGTTFISQTLQLNQIPDKLIVFVRKTLGTQNWGDSDSQLPIRKISINFNNNSGILASATCEDLYRMSKDNGSNQNWQQWVGVGNSRASSSYITSVAGATTGITEKGLGAALGGNLVSSGIWSVQTCGSMLVLEFGHDIQLVEDFFAPGSLGNFNIQLQLTCDNQFVKSVGSNAGDIGVELVMITMNSGVFVCERGTSSTYTGILTRADVLEASEQDAYTRSDVQRMVGGSFHDLLKSGVSKLAPLVKAAVPHIMPHVEKYVKGKLGMGSSGGGMSGGNLSGRYH